MAKPAQINMEAIKKTSTPTKGLSALLKTPLTPSFLKTNMGASPVKRKAITKPTPLTISLDGVEFDVSNKFKGPLSPFDSTGLLRKKFFSPPPPTAPPNITSFTLEDEIAELEQTLAEAKFFTTTAAAVTTTMKPKDKKAFQKTSKATRANAAQLLAGLIDRAKGRKQLQKEANLN